MADSRLTMSLKNLLSKVPALLPLTEEVWPKSAPKEDAPAHHLEASYRNSPLYSATSRPTLDEFLRTNYLMIPEFVKQVNEAKKASGIEESEKDVQITACCQQSLKETTPSVHFVAEQNTGKDVENKQGAVKLTEEIEISRTITGGKKSTLNSQKQITSEEIEVPPPQKPKPRVKKVMKGGCLVIIPAPQPRNRSVHNTPTSAENIIKSDKATVTSADPKQLESHPKEALKEKNFENTNGSQARLKDVDQKSSSVHPKEGKQHLQSDILSGEHKQKPVTLASFCNTDIMEESSQDPVGSPSKKRASVCKEGDKSMHSRDIQDEEPVIEISNGHCVTSQKEEVNKNSGEILLKLKNLPARRGDLPQEPKKSNVISSKAVTGKTDRNYEKNAALLAADPEEISIGNKLMDNLQDEAVVKPANKERDHVEEREDDSVEGLRMNQEKIDIDDKHSTSEDGVLYGNNHFCDDLTSVYVEGHDVTAANDGNNSGTANGSSMCNYDKSDDGDRDDDDGDGDDDDDNDESGNIHDDEGSTKYTEKDKGDNETSDDEDQDDRNGQGGEESVSTNGKISVKVSEDEYAELVMDDTNSDREDEQDEFNPRDSDDDSDEEEGEIKSDYEPEDMHLNSDTEDCTGGITFYQDTTQRKSKNHFRNMQRKKRKAKNQRKKASRKKAKAEKKVCTCKRICKQ